MVSERTPLVSPELLFAQKNAIQRLLDLPWLAVRNHWRALLLAICSAVGCWRAGYADINLFDPLVFKSIFIIFGFTMGFRNITANTRRSEALHELNQLFSALWGIYVCFPDGPRQNIRAPLIEALRAMAFHLESLGAARHYYIYGIVGLEPVESSTPASWCECIFGLRPHPKTPSKLWDDNKEVAHLSPKPLLLATLNLCEAELERIEKEIGGQKLRRNFWAQKKQLLASLDELVSLTMPSVSDRYLSFMDICMSAFAVVFPWGIASKMIVLKVLRNTEWGISSGAFLVVNTIFVTFVMFSLNALSSETEDPFAGGQEDINLGSSVELFASGVANYDVRRAAVEKPANAPSGEAACVQNATAGAQGLSAMAPWELLVKQNALICLGSLECVRREEDFVVV